MTNQLSVGWRRVLLSGCFGLLAGLAFPGVSAAACSLTFSADDGKSYSAAEFRSYVDQEVRPKLISAVGTFRLTISKTCAGQTLTANLTMDQTDYYILAINGHPLAENESRYTNDPVSLSETELENQVDAVADIAHLPTKGTQDAVKTFAYFIAESARFSEIEDQSERMLGSSCTVDWLGYATLVRRWSVISKFAAHSGLHDWTASAGHLLAPITGAERLAYNKAAKTGGPNTDPRDKGKVIAAPPASCPT